MNTPKPSTALEGLGVKTIEKNCSSMVARISASSKRSTAQLRNSLQISHYGSCHRCKNSVSILGIDHFYCSNCNAWIPDPVWAKAGVMASAVEIEAKRGRKKTVVMEGAA